MALFVASCSFPFGYNDEVRYILLSQHCDAQRSGGSQDMTLGFMKKDAAMPVLAYGRDTLLRLVVIASTAKPRHFNLFAPCSLDTIF